MSWRGRVSGVAPLYTMCRNAAGSDRLDDRAGIAAVVLEVLHAGAKLAAWVGAGRGQALAVRGGRLGERVRVSREGPTWAAQRTLSHWSARVRVMF